MAKKNINITLEDNDPIYINLQKIDNKFLRAEFIKHVLFRATQLLEDGSDVFETISKFNNLLDNKRGTYNKRVDTERIEKPNSQEQLVEEQRVFKEQTNSVENKKETVSNKPKLTDLLNNKKEEEPSDGDDLLNFKI